jgi:hypothetical protein
LCAINIEPNSPASDAGKRHCLGFRASWQWFCLSGTEWRKTLVKKIGKADAVVVAVLKTAIESSRTMTELGIAWGANKKMIGVLAPDEHSEELGITPLKNIRLLRAAKADTAELAAEIIKATAPAPHRQET